MSPVQSVTTKWLGNALTNPLNPQPVLYKYNGSKYFFSLLVDLRCEFHVIITHRRHRISVWTSRINQLDGVTNYLDLDHYCVLSE